MALDGGIHHLGTKIVHMIPAFLLLGIGMVLSSDYVQGMSVGMLLVFLFGNVRTRAEYYRWRVKPMEEENDC